jgi:hypothetical protein
MSNIYHDGHRQLHDQFDTTRLATRMEERVHDTITPDDKAFIERMDMFFMSTVDDQGHCNCSYKG